MYVIGGTFDVGHNSQSDENTFSQGVLKIV